MPTLSVRTLIFVAVTLGLPGFTEVLLANPTSKLSASDAAAGDYFGYAVSTNGTVAIVGAPVKNEAAGAVYLYDAIAGNQIAILAGDGAASAFGCSVAVEENIVLVGADLEGYQRGSAYLFDISTGSRIHKLVADGAGHFGDAVALSGSTAIVGAPLTNGTFEYTGAAYLFDVVSGNQITMLMPNDGQTFDSFGSAVGIGASVAIVGAPNDDDVGVDSGSAYLFDSDNGSQIAKLVANDGIAGDNFGASVAISGYTGIVGAPYADNEWSTSSGAAYVFDLTTGNQVAKLMSSDLGVERFGISVAVAGDLAVIGADLDNGVGAAYVFRLSAGEQIAKLVAEDLSTFGLFGNSVSISDSNIIVGAFLESGAVPSSGAAYIFHIVPEPTTPALMLLGIFGGALCLRSRQNSLIS